MYIWPSINLKFNNYFLSSSLVFALEILYQYIEFLIQWQTVKNINGFVIEIIITDSQNMFRENYQLWKIIGNFNALVVLTANWQDSRSTIKILFVKKYLTHLKCPPYK